MGHMRRAMVAIGAVTLLAVSLVGIASAQAPTSADPLVIELLSSGVISQSEPGAGDVANGTTLLKEGLRDADDQDAGTAVWQCTNAESVAWSTVRSISTWRQARTRRTVRSSPRVASKASPANRWRSRAVPAPTPMLVATRRSPRPTTDSPGAWSRRMNVTGTPEGPTRAPLLPGRRMCGMLVLGLVLVGMSGSSVIGSEVSEASEPHAARFLRLVTGDLLRLPDGLVPARATDVRFSPDRREIAYVGPDEDDPTGAKPRLRVVSIDGMERRALSPAESAPFHPAPADPAWSPDGRSIAYVDGEDLRIVDVRSGRDRRVKGVRGSRLWLPSFRPDGRAILYTRVARRGLHIELWTVPVRGGPPRRLMTDAAFGTWSPDGSRIAFRRFGRAVEPGSVWPYHASGLYVADADGGHVQPLRPGSGWMMAGIDWSPIRAEWSPDGTHLVFGKFRGRGYVRARAGRQEPQGHARGLRGVAVVVGRADAVPGEPDALLHPGPSSSSWSPVTRRSDERCQASDHDGCGPFTVPLAAPRRGVGRRRASANPGGARRRSAGRRRGRLAWRTRSPRRAGGRSRPPTTARGCAPCPSPGRCAARCDPRAGHPRGSAARSSRSDASPRRVDLPDVVEAEEAAQQGSIPDERVERGQERHLGVGHGLPSADLGLALLQPRQLAREHVPRAPHALRR